MRIFAQSTRIDRWGWSELDAAVARVRAAGMRVILTVVGPHVRPSPSRFAAFAGAVAARYGADVDRYIIWNEPNLPSWLRPQAKCTNTGAARRSLRTSTARSVRAARPAIRAADPGAQVLIGAMSSRGQDLRSANAGERPMVFLRALGVRRPSYRRLRRAPARASGPRPPTASPSTRTAC